MLASRFGRLIAVGVVLATAGVGHGAEPGSVELPADLQRVLDAHEAAWQAEYARISSILAAEFPPIWLQGAAVPDKYLGTGEDLNLWALHYTIDGHVAYIVVTYGYGDRAASQDNSSFRVDLTELKSPSDSRSFEGVVESLDAAVTLDQVALNAEIEVFDCADQGRKAAFFKLSPQPRDHPVWSALQSVRAGFRCKG